MLGLKVHEVLLDIMEEAFPDNNFTGFFVEMIPKEYATINGRYYSKERRIEIFNLSRTPKSIVITTIHELAHHVDRNIRGRSGHDKQFYQIHKTLLSTAVGMGIVRLTDIKMVNDSLDAEKLETYFGDILKWNVAPKNYKGDKATIKVKFSFGIKDVLKARGYKYSRDEKLWEREMDTVNTDEEVKYLSTIINKNNIIVKKASDIDFEIIYELIVNTTLQNGLVLEELKYKQTDKSDVYRKFIPSVRLNDELLEIKKRGLTNIKLRVSGKQAYSK